jgi:hypothetical protein
MRQYKRNPSNSQYEKTLSADGADLADFFYSFCVISEICGKIKPYFELLTQSHQQFKIPTFFATDGPGWKQNKTRLYAFVVEG